MGRTKKERFQDQLCLKFKSKTKHLMENKREVYILQANNEH